MSRSSGALYVTRYDGCVGSFFSARDSMQIGRRTSVTALRKHTHAHTRALEYTLVASVSCASGDDRRATHIFRPRVPPQQINNRLAAFLSHRLTHAHAFFYFFFLDLQTRTAAL